MKNYIIGGVLILMGCYNPEIKRPVIMGKYYFEKMPCLCAYYYDGFGQRDRRFEDSCYKYNIGDTIK